MISKVEGVGRDWHGHVTAISVSPYYRRCGIASLLMNRLEQLSEGADAYFVDLFVRPSNKVAIEMYKRLGYEVFREIKKYYHDDESAYDMRKPLKRDTDRMSLMKD
eukprot:GHVO01004173.1.p1 GENE.GHVO01004173.1~~GHVO01004173.1.p1  ORF type:complete len:106 (+),score=15.36 GHVO01004173.1:263-580(+)